MKLFIDTANIDEIRTANELGVVDGVTTNPSLISKEGRKFEDVVKEIARIVDGPISAEVISTDASGMIKEGERLSKIHKNIVIKIPMTAEGLKATRVLAKRRIRVNVTLIFSANQALLAAKAGAYFVSPFVGRLDDAGHEGMDVIEEIREIYDNFGFKTQILAASIRSPLHVKLSAIYGADVATVPFNVLMQLVKHPLTDAGLDKFLKDWEKVKDL